MSLDRRHFLALGSSALLLAACDKGGDGKCDDQKSSGDGDKAKAGGGASKPTPEAIAADVKLINTGILLEQGAILAYTAAAGLPFIKSDKAVLTIAGQFMGHHKEHRDALIAAVKKLGGTPADYGTAKAPAIPKPILDEALAADQRKIATLKFARDLERQAAEAYHKLIASQLQTEAAKRGALEILPTEAMHVAVYDLVLKAEKGPVNAGMFSNQA